MKRPISTGRPPGGSGERCDIPVGWQARRYSAAAVAARNVKYRADGTIRLLGEDAGGCALWYPICPA